MRSYLIDALRSSVPQYTLDEVFDKKDAIASDVNQTVSGLMVAYGYDVVSTLITSIDLPADVEQSMNRINSAQRARRRPPSRWPRPSASRRSLRPAPAPRPWSRPVAASRPSARPSPTASRSRSRSSRSGVVGGRGQPAVHLHPVDRHDERVRPQRPPVHRGAAERLSRRRPPCSSRCSWPRRRKAPTSSSSWRKRRSSSFVTPLRASKAVVVDFSQKGAIISLRRGYRGDILSNRVQTRNDARPFRSIE